MKLALWLFGLCLGFSRVGQASPLNTALSIDSSYTVWSTSYNGDNLADTPCQWTDDGSGGAKSCNTARLSESWIEIQVEVAAGAPNFAGSFERRVSAGAYSTCYDFMIFEIDGAPPGFTTEVAASQCCNYASNPCKNSKFSSTAYDTFSFSLGPGTHSLRWTYKKDTQGDYNLDTAWIRNLVIPPAAPVPPTPSCADTPGWSDSSSYDCNYYENNTPPRCDGNSVSDSNFAGFGAEENCCACGKAYDLNNVLGISNGYAVLSSSSGVNCGSWTAVSRGEGAKSCNSAPTPSSTNWIEIVVEVDATKYPSGFSGSFERRVSTYTSYTTCYNYLKFTVNGATYGGSCECGDDSTACKASSMTTTGYDVFEFTLQPGTSTLKWDFVHGDSGGTTYMHTAWVRNVHLPDFSVQAPTASPTGGPTASPTGAPTASPTGAPTPAGGAALVDAEGQQKADYQQKFDATSTLNDAIAVTSDLGDETVAYDEVVEVALKELAAKTQAETMDTTQATNLVAAIAKVGAISEEYVQRTVTAVEVGKTANTLLGETLAVFQADATAQVPFDGLIDVSSEVMESGGCDYLRSGTEKSEQAAYLQQARAPGGVSDYQTNMIKGASGTGDGTSQFSSTLGSVVIPAKSIEADSTQFSVHVIEPQQDWMKTCYENDLTNQESKGSFKINSMLRISVTKADGAEKAITSLKTPFSFKLPVSADRATSGLTIEQEISCGKLQCQYYDPDTKSFKSDGCTTKPHPDGGGALCECTHMTEFALISREQQECTSSAELPVWILLMVLYPFMSGLAARQLFMTLRVSHFKSHLLMNLTHTLVALWCMFRFINSFAWYKDAMELGARQILSMIALTLSTLCFAMLIAAWMYLSSAARGGKGSSALERYRVPIIVLGAVYVVVVMSMTFASASTSSQAPKQGAAVFVAVVVVAMGALFLVMGLRLYFKITTKNFKSKHARKVFLYAVAYAVCLGLECVIKLVSSFADTPDDATFQALIALDGLLDLSAAALIVLIFRRPVAQLVRKGKNLHSSALYASTQQSNSKVSYGAGNSARSRNKSVRSSRNAEKRAMKAGKLSYRINTVEVTPSPRPEETKTTLTGRSSIPEEPVTGRSRSSPMAEPADVNLHLSVSNPIADDDI